MINSKQIRNKGVKEYYYTFDNVIVDKLFQIVFRMNLNNLDDDWEMINNSSIF